MQIYCGPGIGVASAFNVRVDGIMLRV